MSETRIRVARTDARYWLPKLVKRSNDEWWVRMRFGGNQTAWPLKTPNKEHAALKAREIYKSLLSSGFEATLAKFKPWTVEQPKPDQVATVGEYLAAVKAVATVRPTTLTTYERKLRFLVTQLMKLRGTCAKHDYVHGGAAKWRERIDAVSLAELTRERIGQWRASYIAKATNALETRQAQQTAASIIRNSKALFAPDLLKLVNLKLPAPIPFDGVEIGKLPRTRYQSKVNAPLLVKLAHEHLKEQEPDQFAIFLLAFGAGLRRSEIDRLTWKDFNWERGTVSVAPNEYGLTKTEASNDEVDVGPQLLAYFKERMAGSKSEFVINSKAAATAAPHWNRYRCDGHFKALLEWLRLHGVATRNPLHTLRKEFGSLINQQFGIFAASAALRHSGIAITRDHYLDKKQRTALDLSELLDKAEVAP
jgi:integrase